MTQQSTAVAEQPGACYVFHKWQLIKDTGATKYYECKKCKSRKATSTVPGHQPFDLYWLRYGGKLLDDRKQ